MPDQYDMPGPTFEKSPSNLSAARREEPFQPTGRRMPVAIKTTPRPATTQRQMTTLNPRRMTVTVRDSNNRPNEAGIVGPSVFVSNPTVAGLGADDLPASPAEQSAALAQALPKPSTLFLVGAAVALTYFMAFKR